MTLQVLYEDNHIIAVVKPAGVLVQADDTGDATLADEVKHYLKEKYQKPGNVFLGLVHRLDRPVSGIVVFARTSKGAERLSKQFRDRTIQKVYHALVVNHLRQPAATLVHYVIKDEDKNMVTVYDQPVLDALRAELSYETVEARGRYAILRIELKTGRSHQIRAQLSAIDCPIVGDIKYGAPEPLPDRSIALSATSISFKLATKDETVKLEIDLPKEWKNFLK